MLSIPITHPLLRTYFQTFRYVPTTSDHYNSSTHLQKHTKSDEISESLHCSCQWNTKAFWQWHCRFGQDWFNFTRFGNQSIDDVKASERKDNSKSCYTLDIVLNIITIWFVLTYVSWNKNFNASGQKSFLTFYFASLLFLFFPKL